MFQKSILSFKFSIVHMIYTICINIYMCTYAQTFFFLLEEVYRPWLYSTQLRPFLFCSSYYPASLFMAETMACVPLLAPGEHAPPQGFQVRENPRMHTSWFKHCYSLTSHMCVYGHSGQLTHTQCVHTQWASVNFVSLALSPSGHRCTSVSLGTAPPSALAMCTWIGYCHLVACQFQSGHSDC